MRFVSRISSAVRSVHCSACVVSNPRREGKEARRVEIYVYVRRRDYFYLLEYRYR